MYKCKALLYLVFLGILCLLSCSCSNRYSRHNVYGPGERGTFLHNDPLAFSIDFPSDYTIKNKVSYPEHRTARKLLPKNLPVKYRYLLFKAINSSEEYTQYTWRIPNDLLDITSLAQRPQWTKKEDYFYAIDTASVPATALMVAVYPGEQAHYVLLMKAEAKDQEKLSAKTQAMKKEYFEVLEHMSTQAAE